MRHETRQLIIASVGVMPVTLTLAVNVIYKEPITPYLIFACIIFLINLAVLGKSIIDFVRSRAQIKKYGPQLLPLPDRVVIRRGSNEDQIVGVSSFWFRAVDDYSESHPTVPDPFLIGDRTCTFNARSPHLRCTVNPNGPCEDCPNYEPRESHN